MRLGHPAAGRELQLSFLCGGVVYGTSQKLAIRKEILQAVSEQYDVSVSAVDSGIRRMIDQLEAKHRSSGCASRRKADLRTRNLPLVN